MIDPKRLEEFCQLGEKADTLLRQGRTRDALKAYEELAAKIETSGSIDSYLMAKLTLGVLRCHVKVADFKSAFTVWNATIEDGLYGIGIYALESAQTTVRDMLTYDLLCAFLHTLAKAEPKEAATAVNQYMSRVCEQATEDADRSTLRQAVSNWKQHLREIFQGSIPHAFAVPLIKFERTLEEPVKPQPIDFPFPTEWEKPQDFREMSRVVQLKKVAHPSERPAGPRRRRAS